MPLSELAKLVSKLTQPNPDGQKARIAFNNDPKTEGAALSGDEWAALLTFQKGIIAQQVVTSFTASNGDLSAIADVRDHIDWLYDFARWQWPTGESNLYVGDTPPAVGATPLYGGANCQIHKVEAAEVPAGDPHTFDVTLDVWVEGAVDHIAIVVLDGPTPVHEDVNPVRSPASTFRYARLTTTCQLKANADGTPRTYRARVVNKFDGGAKTTIETSGKDTFTVP